MENCTIYSHHLEFDKVVGIVKSNLPKASLEVHESGLQKSLKATIKGGFFSKSSSLTINYRQREKPSYKLEEISCGLTQNLAGMVGFIQSIPADNEAVRNQFLYKVKSMNCEMPFMAEPAITPEFAAVLRQITKELDAFVFAQPNKLFTKSNGQYFADKDLKLILDTSGKCEISALDVSVDAKYSEQFQEKYSAEQLDRKSETEALLQEKGIKVNKHLPCVPSSDNVKIREIDEIVDRAYALLIVAAKGEGIEQLYLDKMIERMGISKFSPRESEIVRSAQLTEQDKAYATWRYEGLYVMLWVLGKMRELKFPDEICDVQEVVGLMVAHSREEFQDSVQLKPVTEILDELDKVYRMNWACVDARIKGEQVSGPIIPGVVYERHYALNWLTNYQNQAWDDVQTNT